MLFLFLNSFKMSAFHWLLQFDRIATGYDILSGFKSTMTIMSNRIEILVCIFFLLLPKRQTSSLIAVEIKLH